MPSITIRETSANWQQELTSAIVDNFHIVYVVLGTDARAVQLNTVVSSLMSSYPNVTGVYVPELTPAIVQHLKSLAQDVSRTGYQNNFSNCLAFTLSPSANIIADYIMGYEPNATDNYRVLRGYALALDLP